MKKIILILFALLIISCEWKEHPVQDVSKSDDVTNIIAYAPGHYDCDSIYYRLTTRYQDCRIVDYGTARVIDSIMARRYKEVILLKQTYDNLQTRAKAPKSENNTAIIESDSAKRMRFYKTHYKEYR